MKTQNKTKQKKTNLDLSKGKLHLKVYSTEWSGAIVTGETLPPGELHTL